MSRSGTGSGRSALPLILCAFAFIGCRDDDRNQFVAPPPPEVIVALPEQRDVTGYYTYTGVTDASETVELRARVQGFLREVHFKPGQKVNQGDLLFTIDEREFKARVEEVEATLSSAKARLDLAQTTLARAQQAFTGGAVTELEIKEKTASRDEAKAAVDLAEANLVNTRLDLSYCQIKAPISGRIGKNLVDAGNLVGRGEPTLLAVITSATPSYVTVDVPEQVVLEFRRRLGPLYASGKIEPGQTPEGKWRRAELSLADGGAFDIIGQIDYVSPTLNAATGTIKVRTRFENQDEFLLPGLFVRVRVPRETAAALLVLDEALLTDQIGRYALVVGSDGVVEQKRVKIGPQEGSLRVVTQGLDPGDRVVVRGVQRARPGLKVTPKTAAETAAATPAPKPTTGETPKN